MKNPYIGSKFDDFLEDESLLAECQAQALKRVLAWQLQQFLQEHQIAQSQFAEQIGTSRSQVSRLLDPNNTSVTLKTMSNAAEAIGKRLEIKLV